MALLATVATLADDSADPQELTEWLDACVLAHLEEGVAYERAERLCRSHVRRASGA